MNERPRVLFIGGWGRSGSTLLDRILGQVPGVFSAGEVREIWERGCLEDRPCGCDRPFSTCEVWSEVGQVAFGGWERLDLNEVLRLRFRLDRPWMVPLIAPRRTMPSLRRDLDRYTDILAALYRAIWSVTGADLIVDSTKIPSHAYLLWRSQVVDLRVLHLIRDSRGVAYSWQKRVPKKVTVGETRYLPRYGPIGSSIRWLVYNAETAWLQRGGVPYRRLRYEDLIADPRAWTKRILRFAGLPDRERDLPFTGPHQVQLGPNHTVDGNPIRFSTGHLTLRTDEEWRTNLPAFDRWLVTAGTLPGLLRYGYLSPRLGVERG